MTRKQKHAKAIRIEKEIDERIAHLARTILPPDYRRKEAERIVKLRTEATRLSA